VTVCPSHAGIVSVQVTHATIMRSSLVEDSRMTLASSLYT